MGFGEDIQAERLLPTDKAYSVVQLDTGKPPGDPDCATKLFEVDDLDEAGVSSNDWCIYIAYDADGNGYDVG